MVQAVEDTIFHFSDNIVYGDMRASLIKIGTALVTSPGRPPARRAYGSERKRVPSWERILKVHPVK